MPLDGVEGLVAWREGVAVTDRIGPDVAKKAPHHVDFNREVLDN